MSERDEFRDAAARLLDAEPAEGAPSSNLYASPRPLPVAKPRGRIDDKPTHYKVICISMYTDDLKRLDQMIDTLKARGLTKANRSALIRHALAAVDLDRVPKGL